MKSYLGIGLIIIGLVVFFGFAIPEWKATGATRSEVDALKEINKDVDDAIAIHGDLIKRYNDIARADIDRLQTMIPPSENREQIILTLRNIASRNGMNIEDLSFTENSGTDGGVLSQKLTVSGPYDGFQGFLRDVESSLRLTNVERIQFSASDDGNYSFSVVLQSYFIDSEIIAKDR